MQTLSNQEMLKDDSENYFSREPEWLQSPLGRQIRIHDLSGMKNLNSSRMSFMIIFVLAAGICFVLQAQNVYAAACTFTSTGNGNWTTAATWTSSGTTCSSYPGQTYAGDTVIITDSSTVTLDASPAYTIASLTVNAITSKSNNGITFGGAYTLTVSGAVTMTLPQKNNTSSIAVSTGTLNAGSLYIPGDTNTHQDCVVSLSTGTIHVSGNITFAGTAAQAQLTVTGSGTINMGGNLGAGGTFSAGSGTVNFSGTSAQTFAGYTYHIVKINNTAGVTPVAAPTIPTLTIADVTANSVFNDGGFAIATATTLNLNSGTYHCTATSFPWGTLNAGTGTVNYGLAGNQTVAAKTYYNLTLSNSGNKTFSGSVAVSKNLSINSTAKALLTNGTNSTAYSLLLDGALQVCGTWGSTSSAATNVNDTYFVSGYTGLVTLSCPSLTIVKSASANPVTSGQTITYTILITNTGSSNAINATVTDPLPKYTTYVSNSTRLNSITVAGDGATLPLIAGLLIDNNTSRTPGAAATGILPAGTSATVTFQVTIN